MNFYHCLLCFEAILNHLHSHFLFLRARAKETRDEDAPEGCLQTFCVVELNQRCVNVHFQNPQLPEASLGQVGGFVRNVS